MCHIIQEKNLKNVLFKQFFKIFHVVSATWCMMSTATQKQIIVMNLGKYSILGVHLTKKETLDWNYGVFFLTLFLRNFLAILHVSNEIRKKSWTEAFFRGAKLQIVEVNIQGKMIRAKKYKISQLYFLTCRGDYGTTLSGFIRVSKATSGVP
jgi:hypothetical protein